MINIRLENPKSIKKFVDVQKTLNGDYILREHPDIDIVVMPEKTKVLILPKVEISDSIYKLQDKMFKFLLKKGVILPDTIKGSNVFGGLEAMYPKQPPSGENPMQVVIFAISNFLDQERPEYLYHQEYVKAMEDNLLNPDEKNSTELGEIEQKEKQGSIRDSSSRNTIYQYMLESMNINLEEGTDDEEIDSNVVNMFGKKEEIKKKLLQDITKTFTKFYLNYKNVYERPYFLKLTNWGEYDVVNNFNKIIDSLERNKNLNEIIPTIKMLLTVILENQSNKQSPIGPQLLPEHVSIVTKLLQDVDKFSKYI